jgi:hypothetical protein
MNVVKEVTPHSRHNNSFTQDKYRTMATYTVNSPFAKWIKIFRHANVRNTGRDVLANLKAIVKLYEKI